MITTLKAENIIVRAFAEGFGLGSGGWGVGGGLNKVNDYVAQLDRLR